MTLGRTHREPSAQIAAQNPWYVDDQIAAQLGTPAFAHVVQRRWRRLHGGLAWLAPRRGGPLRILDAGCGDGVNLIGLRQAVDALGLKADIVATDYNSLRTSRALGRGPNVGVLVAVLHHLPFADHSFDVVLCNHVLEHVPNDVAALTELGRVLRRDGVLILNVPNEGCLLAGLRNRILQRHLLASTDHVHFYTRRRLSRCLSAAGLRDLTWHRDGFFLPHTRLQALATSTASGRRTLDVAGRLVPSQAADLMVFARRAEVPCGR